jgi:hypothetical protein
LRTIDRARVRLGLGDEEIALRNGAVFRALRRIELVPLSPAVLERAAQPFPTSLGTLDAIHLSSALLWSQGREGRPVLLTHDGELGLAARALGFEVLGL